MAERRSATDMRYEEPEDTDDPGESETDATS